MNLAKLTFKKIFSTIINIYTLFYLSLFITDYSFLSVLFNKIFGISEIYISNIAPHTPVLILLLFVRWFIDKDSFKGVFVVRNLIKLFKLNDRQILFIIFFLTVSVMLGMSIARHLSLSSTAIDLGIFDQAIWNTTQGRILVSSLRDNMNLLGEHFQPAFFFLVPLYFLWSSPIVLFIVQSLVLGAAIFPLYLIAKQRLTERPIIFALLISYFLSGGIRGVGFSDFHLECFIVFLLFLCYYLLITRKIAWFFVSIAILLLCKEDAAFLVSAFGIYAYFIRKNRPVGIVLFLGGIVSWIVATKFIIPYFNPSGKYIFPYCLPFGNTYMKNIQFIMANPLAIFNLILHPNNINYYFKLFGSVGFLSLLSPAHFTLIAIPLLKNAIGAKSYPGIVHIHSHYIAHLLPFIYISAIYGSGWFIDRFSGRGLSINKTRRKKVVIFLSIYIIVISLLFYGKTDGYKFMKFIRGAKQNRASQIREYLRLVPEDVSVATNYNLLPHLSHREYIFIWYPYDKESSLTEYVVVDKKLLDYIPAKERSKVNEFFSNFSQFGYTKVFASEDDSFVILFNPRANKALIKEYFNSIKKR